METDKLPQCPHCKIELRDLGQLPIRVGGATGPRQFWFGQYAELDEQIKPLDLYRCEKCGRLEFYDHDFSLPER